MHRYSFIWCVFILSLFLCGSASANPYAFPENELELWPSGFRAEVYSDAYETIYEGQTSVVCQRLPIKEDIGVLDAHADCITDKKTNVVNVETSSNFKTEDGGDSGDLVFNYVTLTTTCIPPGAWLIQCPVAAYDPYCITITIEVTESSPSCASYYDVYSSYDMDTSYDLETSRDMGTSQESAAAQPSKDKGCSFTPIVYSPASASLSEALIVLFAVALLGLGSRLRRHG
jgi:hypothetical protein